MNILEELLAERGVLILDGAMGTELFERGLESGDAPERWNVDQPETITAVHTAYIEAGSDLILTNSFGGTSYRLALHKLEDRRVELNRAAAEVGRAAADAADRRIVVAGSMGPTGELLEPMGTMTRDDCQAAFAEQASGLAEGGADVLWLETLSDLDEVEAAVLGAQSVCDLPIVSTMSFDTAGRTMMGVTGQAAALRLSALGVAAVGANCGNNLRDTENAVAEMKAAGTDTLIVSKANAGIPIWHGDGLIYDGSPEVMGAHAARLRDAGVQLIGTCCGSSAKHTAFVRGVIDGTIPRPDIEAPAAVATGPTDRKRVRRRR